MPQTKEKTFSLSWITGKGASVIALAGFMGVSVFATAMGFLDLRLANLDRTSMEWTEQLPVWALTVFVILAMVAALNAALGVGFAHDAEGGDKKRPLLRFIATLFYVFFAFWSVGFGYGFFWKELAGQEYTQGQFRTAIEDVSNSVARSTEALQAVETAVDDAANSARSRAIEESELGGTCANRPGSQAGDGPLTRARFAFADRAEALKDDVDANWTSQLIADRRILATRIEALSQGEVPASAASFGAEEAALLQQLATASELESTERRRLFARVFDDAKAFTSKVNGLRDRQASAFANRLDTLAMEVGPDPDSPGRPNPTRENDVSYCWDTVLTEKLSAAADLLRNLNDMPAPEFEFTEGPKATRAAFFNLARAVSPPYNDNASDLVFGEKEFIALFASIAVDLGILFLTLVRAAMERKGSARERRWPERFDLNDMRRLAQRADPRYVIQPDDEDDGEDNSHAVAQRAPPQERVKDAHFEDIQDNRPSRKITLTKGVLPSDKSQKK